ncbi:hypothetical protein [Alkalihalobacillus pseudalcaliphilus]|uniref:hypothetical protein n=1 Tax=Alkalihalobacillus pseudalcaliphilus TaxID=79884 RepID=UPI00064E0F5C|nr:hypothetical protein [Alkalihalobacillus pseudalcaliphilus]KMK76848.1 hypothetical protein AB990_08095 [Alkalihalobacillus pseudalcaliphilus]
MKSILVALIVTTMLLIGCQVQSETNQEQPNDSQAYREMMVKENDYFKVSISIPIHVQINSEFMVEVELTYLGDEDLELWQGPSPLQLEFDGDEKQSDYHSIAIQSIYSKGNLEKINKQVNPNQAGTFELSFQWTFEGDGVEELIDGLAIEPIDIHVE